LVGAGELRDADRVGFGAQRTAALPRSASAERYVSSPIAKRRALGTPEKSLRSWFEPLRQSSEITVQRADLSNDTPWISLLKLITYRATGACINEGVEGSGLAMKHFPDSTGFRG
jgi:hypothetical protein